MLEFVTEFFLLAFPGTMTPLAFAAGEGYGGDERLEPEGLFIPL